MRSKPSISAPEFPLTRGAKLPKAGVIAKFDPNPVTMLIGDGYRYIATMWRPVCYPSKTSKAAGWIFALASTAAARYGPDRNAYQPPHRGHDRAQTPTQGRAWRQLSGEQ